jgi:cytidine deaminase
LARKVARQADYAAKETERKKLGDMLEKEDRSGNVFRVAKQTVKRIRDVEDSSVWPCGVCRRGVGQNSVECIL